MNQRPLPPAVAIEKKPPLFVDLDGTLVQTDTLVESVILLIKHQPSSLLNIPLWLLKGRAAFKEEVAKRVQFSAVNLPYRQPLINFLATERAQGRQIILATAAHQKIADVVANHLNLFDGVLASTATNNLKGKNKLDAIRVMTGAGADFSYAGDSRADIPIWRQAKTAILVGAPTRVAQIVYQHTPIECELKQTKPGLKTWLRALRVYQWLKNLLLFVPLLTAFSFFDFNKLATIVVAFFSFSLAASATYLVNDLWDLENDRAHPRKRNRPFASGNISISYGLSVAFIALLSAFALAASISITFSLTLLFYLALTSAYSWVLKQYVLIDVLILALLYTLRIIAGSVAIDISASAWLLAFSVFIFFSLALVKRCSELVSLIQSGGQSTSGRDYNVSDLIVLMPLGIGAALSAVVIFGLFINALETLQNYTSPPLLWIAAFGMIYWLARLWIKTARGEMHDDPLVFALKDFGSRITIIAIIITTIAARFLPIGQT